jgi:hypothetical protein
MNNGEFYKSNLPQLVIDKEERAILENFEIIEQRGPSNQRRDLLKNYQSDELKSKQIEG